MNLSREQILNIDDLVQTLRRRRNKELEEFVNGERYVYNGEDAMRLVGELNATHNHICSVLAADHDSANIYCCLKHMATAYVLSNEVDGDCKEVMDIIELLTNGKIKACQACSDDVDQLEVKEEESE